MTTPGFALTRRARWVTTDPAVHAPRSVRPDTLHRAPDMSSGQRSRLSQLWELAHWVESVGLALASCDCDETQVAKERRIAATRLRLQAGLRCLATNQLRIGRSSSRLHNTALAS